MHLAPSVHAFVHFMAVLLKAVKPVHAHHKNFGDRKGSQVLTFKWVNCQLQACPRFPTLPQPLQH